jgi:hypothetical protein
MTNPIPLSEINKRIEYKDGILYHKYRSDMPDRWNDRFANKPLKIFNTFGYSRFRMSYEGKAYNLRVHIITWSILNGRYPSKCIDHKNSKRSDNLIENLREANHYQNSLNRPPLDNKSSQYKGVYWSYNKWRVQPEIDGVKYSVGRFYDEIEAALSYNDFVRKNHDTEFAYMNDISMGYTNKEYPNMPRHYEPEEVAA